MNDAQKPTETENTEPEERENGNVVVLFKMSEERSKAKKEAAKNRRDFLRDRMGEREFDRKIAR